MSYKNLVIKQGESWSEPVALSDGIGGPLNLTNYLFEATIKKAYSSIYHTPITVTVDDAAAGTLTLSLTAAETSALKSGRYVYALRLYAANQEVDAVILDGIITVEASALIGTVG